MVRLVLIGDNDVDLLARARALGNAGFTVDILIQHVQPRDGRGSCVPQTCLDIAFAFVGSPTTTSSRTSPFVPCELHGDATSPNETGRRQVECPPNYAAARWARAVAKLAKEERDVRTIAEWARSVGVSAGALRNWCRAAGVSPRKSVILSRLLRCVRQADGVAWRAEQFLDVTDPRTLAKILEAGGLETTNGRVTVDELLNRQKLINDDSAIAVLRTLLQAHAPSKSTAVNVEDRVCSRA